MDTMRVRTRVLLAFIGIVLAACARTSVFLGDYSDLAEKGVERGVYFYQNPERGLGGYWKLMVDEVYIHYHPKAHKNLVDPAMVADFARLMRQEIKRYLTLNGKYRIVNEPGPDTLRIKPAIIGLYPRRSLLYLEPPTKIRRLGLDRAVVEVDFTDSVTGVRLGALRDTRGAERVEGVVTERLDRPATMVDIVEEWAKLIKETLDTGKHVQ